MLTKEDVTTWEKQYKQIETIVSRLSIEEILHLFKDDTTYNFFENGTHYIDLNYRDILVTIISDDNGTRLSNSYERYFSDGTFIDVVNINENN